MKICGCENAEKGYVIINPDSPDRREILSLNPPICREIIGNSLDIDGEIYFFEKEIEDWDLTPITGGIRIEWSPTDIVFLGGTSATISAISFDTELWAIGIVTGNCSTWVNASIKVGYSSSIPQQTIKDNPSKGCPIGTPLHNQGVQMEEIRGITEGSSYAGVTWQFVPFLELRPVPKNLFAIGAVTGNCSTWIEGFEIDLGSSNSIPSQSIRNSPSTGCPDGFPLSSQGVQMNDIAGYPATSEGTTYYLVTWRSVPALQLRGNASPTGYRVETNTNEISERITNSPPALSELEGNCGLQVNFSDNTQSPLIEFPQCPQNIKKIESLEISDTGGILEQIAPAPSGEIVISCGERECPPETCFDCDCSELNCCYDENGRLIDSFIRRT